MCSISCSTAVSRHQQHTRHHRHIIPLFAYSRILAGRGDLASNPTVDASPVQTVVPDIELRGERCCPAVVPDIEPDPGSVLCLDRGLQRHAQRAIPEAWLQGRWDSGLAIPTARGVHSPDMIGTMNVVGTACCKFADARRNVKIIVLGERTDAQA